MWLESIHTLGKSICMTIYGNALFCLFILLILQELDFAHQSFIRSFDSILKDILLRNEANQSLNWYKSLEEYYFRPEWELYDLKIDDHEEFNVASKESYKVYNLIVINEFFVISCKYKPNICQNYSFSWFRKHLKTWNKV